MRAVLLACFFLSGASGLILESLWTRELGLVFGSTTLAISTVLATFMGGLGLGSYLAGRYADKIKNPVRAYAIAEAGIGLYALLIPVILWAYPSFNGWMYRVFGDRWLLLSMVRFAGSAGLLLIPTTLIFHAFWGIDPKEAAMQQINFLKNVSIAGGMLMVFAFGPGRYSADKA